MDHKGGANGKITLQTFNQGRNDGKDISNEKSEFVGISLAKIPYTIPFRKYSPFFRKKNTDNQCSLFIKNGTKHQRQDSIHQYTTESGVSVTASLPFL
jgi:hypothetical protein